MSQAYATRDPKRARRLLENLARRLDPDYPGAAASLREGLEETLTVMRLDLPDSLERVLSSQSDREPVQPGARDRAPRKALAARHHDPAMDPAGVLEAERSFRKVAGYRALPKLVAALRVHDAAINRERRVDNGRRAA